MTFQETLASEPIKQLQRDLFFSIENESHRGAVLLAVTVLEDHLLNCVKNIYPDDKSDDKDLFNRLFGKHGIFKGLDKAPKILYALGHVNKTTYTAIDKLRAIRNKAAHLNTPFDLNDEEWKGTFNEVFNLGPGMSKYVGDIALQAAADEIIEQLKSILDEHLDSTEEKQEYFTKMIPEYSNAFNRKAERRIPYLKLAIGVPIICALVTYGFNKTDHELS